LEFEEQTPLDARGWTVTGPADRWVLTAANDAELSDLLAQTVAWEHPEAAREQQDGPPIPEGQTALVYFVGYRPDTAVRDSTVGVYESEGDWVVAVERTRGTDGGAAVVCYERHLMFVDAPPPASVRLRFEDTTKTPSEVTWW
jgi:hypothetical protein